MHSGEASSATIVLCGGGLTVPFGYAEIIGRCFPNGLLNGISYAGADAGRQLLRRRKGPFTKRPTF